MSLIEGVTPTGAVVPIRVSSSGELALSTAGDSGSSDSGSSVFTSAVIDIVQTSTTGSDFVNLPAGNCRAVDLVNASGVAIEYRRGGTGPALTIPAGSARLIIGIANSNQISIRRADLSNTSITIAFERLS